MIILYEEVAVMCFVFSYDELIWSTEKFIVYTLVGDEKFEKFCYAYKDQRPKIEYNDLFLGIFVGPWSSDIIRELKERINLGRPYKTKYMITTSITYNPSHHNEEKRTFLRRVLMHLSLDVDKIFKMIDKMTDIFLYELKVHKDRNITYTERFDNVEVSLIGTPTTYTSIHVHIYGYGKLGELIDKTEHLVYNHHIAVRIGSEWNKLIKQPMNFVYCEEIN